MTIYFSASARGFYTDELHGDSKPADSVPITEEQHAALLLGQERGKVISHDSDGAPVLVDAPAPTREQLQARLRAMVQRRLDQLARGQGFQGIADAMTYCDEPAVPDMQSKALALRALRSRVWAYVAQQQQADPLPEPAQLLAGLPQQ